MQLSCASAIDRQIFSGLVELGPNFDLIPDVAKRWEILDDGTRYRFHLRKDVFWTDGIQVTAGDFEFAAKRQLVPNEDQPIFSRDVVAVIKGVAAILAGKKVDEGEIGVTAVDDFTLEIELDSPIAYFLHLMALPQIFPVPRHVIEKYKEKWTDLDKIATNGPFTLLEYEAEERIVLKRNEAYHRPFFGNIESVEINIPNNQDHEKMYVDGQIDVIGFNSKLDEDFAQRYSKDLHIFPSFGLRYLLFNTQKPPFDDRRVRLALSQALDRDQIIFHLGKGYQKAFGGVLPPGMPGHSAEIGPKQDIDSAQQLLEEAGYPGGKGFPQLEIYTWDFVSNEEITGQIIAQLDNYLNIRLLHRSLSFNKFNDRLREDPPYLHVSGWVADYADPSTFFNSQWLQNSNWFNQEYLSLITKAQSEMDHGLRMSMYQKSGSADH